MAGCAARDPAPAAHPGPREVVVKMATTKWVARWARGRFRISCVAKKLMMRSYCVRSLTTTNTLLVDTAGFGHLQYISLVVNRTSYFGAGAMS